VKHLTTLLFVLSLSATATLFAQQPSIPNAATTCDISEVHNVDGWAVPGLKRAVVQGKPIQYPNGVVAKSLVPRDRQASFTYFRCSEDHRGRLEVGEFPIGIYQIISFEVGGRVFAYYVHLGRERLENGKRADFGTELQIIYYDLDGSGRFTLRKYTMVRSPEFTPDWVHVKP
jgi:hypothetical protein